MQENGSGFGNFERAAIFSSEVSKTEFGTSPEMNPDQQAVNTPELQQNLGLFQNEQGAQIDANGNILGDPTKNPNLMPFNPDDIPNADEYSYANARQAGQNILGAEELGAFSAANDEFAGQDRLKAEVTGEEVTGTDLTSRLGVEVNGAGKTMLARVEKAKKIGKYNEQNMEMNRIQDDALNIWFNRVIGDNN